MPKEETYNLPFTVEVDERNRTYIPKPIADLIKLKGGDKITLLLTSLYRKEK
jgi:AbrB family looped-hinge helix DNA binding protein